LRELTGPVVVRQEAEPGAKRPAWFAEFNLDLAKVAVRLGGRGDCPGRETWEFRETGPGGGDRASETGFLSRSDPAW